MQPAPTHPWTLGLGLQRKGVGALPPAPPTLSSLEPSSFPRADVSPQVLCKSVCPPGQSVPSPSHHPLGPGVEGCRDLRAPWEPWAVGLPGDRDIEHLHLGEPLPESTTTHHPLSHRVSLGPPRCGSQLVPHGEPPITAPSPCLPAIPSSQYCLFVDGGRLGRVDPSC